MKYCRTILAMVCFMAAPAFGDTTWVTCGSPSASNVIPFWGSGTDAMRFQVLYYQGDINQPGNIVAFGLYTGGNAAAAFHRVRVKLCHTPVASLSTTFADNYGGNTPQVMLDTDTLIVGTGAARDWYYFPCSFAYNNRDNLLLEIQWRGDAGQTVAFYRNASGSVPRRAWNSGNDTAAVGQTDNVQAYYARLGFVPTGMEEGSRAAAPGPVLEVLPGIGRGSFTVRCFWVSPARAELTVSDIAGRLVGRLAPVAGVGGLEAVWHATGVPAGVYLVRAGFAGHSITRRLVVVD